MCHQGFLHYQPCWKKAGKLASWKRGVGHLCGSVGSGLAAFRAPSLSRLCSLFLQGSCSEPSSLRSQSNGCSLAVARGLAAAVQLLAWATLPSPSAVEEPGNAFDLPQHEQMRWQLQAAASAASSELTHSLSAGSKSVEDIVGNAATLVERLDRLAHTFPAEIGSMRFDLAYPALLSPSGTCVDDSSASRLLLQPRQRWFRAEVDGTRFHSPWPSVATLLARWEGAGGRLTRWTLNLGAGDGRCEGGDEYDPSNCLVQKHNWRGVLVEAKSDLADQAESRLASAGDGRQRGIRVVASSIDPSNVTAVVLAEARSLLAADVDAEDGQSKSHEERWLHLAEIIRKPDLVKIDLDHADCAVLGRLLEVMEPLILHVEINPLFPPPFVYEEKWRGHDQVQSVVDSHHLIGCSLQAFVEVTRRHWGARAIPEPYQVHHVEFENAVLLHPDVANLFLPSSSAGVLEDKQSQQDILDRYTAGYFCHPLRGVLSQREVLAQHDFREWRDDKLTLQTRGRKMRRFLNRAWKRGLMAEHTWQTGGDDSIQKSVSTFYNLTWLEPRTKQI
eukprot:TRINITY_DN32319_c0_g1_i1.p1 TRINITY_DN32319_c0_g1~~TRINITY_DN32319_c0_g1_i1.p1  ORF type:complete len:559 (-),score=92.79 TRINITY_DN32319_c0_g1_i1:112-1788(-)